MRRFLTLALLVGPSPWATALSVRAQVPGPAQDTAPRTVWTAPLGGASALRPAPALAPPGGLTILPLPVPGSPRVALRLSVPVEEGPREAGAARVLQLLALERMRAAAAPVGARVDATRTPGGVAFSVEGAAADFDHLAFVLREAVAEPTSDVVSFERARGRALSDALRLRETAVGHLASTLRGRIDANPQLPEGTPATLRALDRQTLRDVWRRSHRRVRMTLVVVGDVPAELLLAAFRSAGAPDGGPSERPSASAPADEGGRTEVLRSWYGEAREAGDLRDPRGLVAAALVGARLRVLTDGRTESRLEVWEIGPRRVLAVMAAAYPGEGRGLQPLVSGVLGETLRAVDDAAVDAAVADVRASLLQGARTASGLAALVGRYHDATGDPAGAAVLVEALERLDATALRAYLQELSGRTPVRAEVRP